MKKLFKFVASLMITVVISTTTAAAYVQPVEAATDSVWKKAGIKFVEAIAGVFGTVLGEGAVEPIGINGEMQAYIDSIYGTDDLTENGDGTFTFSEEAIMQMKTLLDEYFSQEENVSDVVWMPVVRADEIPAANFSSITKYYQMRSYMDEHKLALFSCAGAENTNMSVFNATDIVFYGYSTSQFDKGAGFINEWSEKWGTSDYTMSSHSNHNVMFPYLYVATKDGVRTGFYLDGYYTTDGWTSYEGDTARYSMACILYPFNETKNYPNYMDYTYLIASEDYEARYIPLFRDLSTYKNYITGGADYYQLTPTYQGGALTVDPNIDYGKLYDAVSAAMSNSAANGENVTQQLSAMQGAYEATMQEISGTLGDIEDNTEQSNSWLEKIYNNTASIASILIEQFDAMTETINNGFANVVDGLSDVSLGLGEIGDSSGGGSGGDGGSKLSFWDRLGNFFGTTLGGVFDLISIIIMKALDGVGWLADKLIDNLGKALDGVSEIMDRYTKKITENNTLSKLGEAIPPELKDLFTFFFFGVIGAGIIRAAKK